MVSGPSDAHARAPESVEINLVLVEPSPPGLAGVRRSFSSRRGRCGPLPNPPEACGQAAAPVVTPRLPASPQDTGFRRHDQDIIVRHQVARGAQAVAVQGSPDHTPVREGHRRRDRPRAPSGRRGIRRRLLVGVHGAVGVPSLGISMAKTCGRGGRPCRATRQHCPGWLSRFRPVG